TFPVKGGPRLTYSGSRDAFVAKVSADGTALVYCGYIGGSGTDSGTATAVDSAGNACVVGTTSSNETTLPVFRGPDLKRGSEPLSVLMAKVKADGTGFIYLGYITGPGRYGRSGTGVALDGAGNAY